MDSFSWSDSLRATVGSCLPCLAPRHDDSDGEQQTQRGVTGARSARDELERLLDEPMTDHDEAETMSLHSNIDSSARRRKKKSKRSGQSKSIRIFGFDLFGRQTGGIQLGDEEDEEDSSRPNRRGQRISSSTLDSDAAPLADDAINNFTFRAQQRWAPEITDEQLAAEEAAERERSELERKTRRKERKAMKRLVDMRAFDNEHDGEEFEGFPGSGGGVSSNVDDFGPFIDGHASAAHIEQSSHNAMHEEDEAAAADFDATSYNKKRGTTQQDGSSGGSRSRSRSSADHLRKQSMSSSPRTAPPPEDSTPTPKVPRTKRSKSDKSGASNRSKSSHGSTGSTSLQSPSLPPSPNVRVLPSQADADFEGIPGGRFSARDILPQGLISPIPKSTSFPSAGFSAPRRMSSGLSGNAGVALARRGDE